MAKPSDDMMLNPSTIEGIDLNAEIPCAPDNDEHLADLIVRQECPGCRNSHVLGWCRDVWEWSSRHQFKCSVCHIGNLSLDQIARIVEVLR